MRKLRTPVNELWKVNRPEYDKWLQEVMLHNIGDFIESLFDLNGQEQGVLAESQNVSALRLTNVTYDDVGYSVSFGINTGTGFFRNGDILQLLRWEGQASYNFAIPTSDPNLPFAMGVYLVSTFQNSYDTQYVVPKIPLVDGDTVVVRQDLITSISLVNMADTAPEGIYLGKLKFEADGSGNPTTFDEYNFADVNYVSFRPTKARFAEFDTRISSLNSKIGNVQLIGGNSVVTFLNNLETDINSNAMTLGLLSQALFNKDIITQTDVDGYMTIGEMDTSLITILAEQQTMRDRFEILGMVTGLSYDVAKGTIDSRLNTLESYPDGVFNVAQDVDLRTIKLITTDDGLHYECSQGLSPESAVVAAANQLDASSIDSYINKHAGFNFMSGAFTQKLDYSLVDSVGVLDLYLDTHRPGDLTWIYGEHQDDRILLQKSFAYTMAGGAVKTYSGQIVGVSFRGYVNAPNDNAYLTLETNDGATKTLIHVDPIDNGYSAAFAQSFLTGGIPFVKNMTIRAGTWNGSAWEDMDANIQGNLVIHYLFTGSTLS